MIKLPYGTCDFYKIITDEYYYVDRTAYIPMIEAIGSTLVFLRPRRFGKSLLLSMLENYYDVKKANDFDRLFGNLAIGKDPTPLHNQYFVLKWDFSEVNTWGDMAELQTSVHTLLNDAAVNFFDRYGALLPRAITINPTDGLSTFRNLLSVVQTTSHKLYLLIDEYDNFANTVLMHQTYGSKERYESLVRGEGFLKTVFKVIKASLAGRGLDRVFITGVSPMVINDMTSGFNMSKNITVEPRFYDLCGFSEDEVGTLVQQIAQSRSIPESQTNDALDTMRTFYNGYSFTPQHPPHLYNPTLTLYFLDYLQFHTTFPPEILDENLALDYQKLAYIARQPSGPTIIAQAVNDDPALALSSFSGQFGVDDIIRREKTDQFLLLLMYYFGIITCTGQYNAQAKHLLTIPNLVTKQLYLNQLRDLILTTAPLKNQADEVVHTCYATGRIADLCAFIEDHYFSCFENRDYTWINELTVKSIFLTLVQNNLYYSTFSEKPTQRGVADLVLLLKPDQRFQPLQDFLFEFKYLAPKKDLHLTGVEIKALNTAEAEALPETRKAFADAEAAIHRYRAALYHQYGDSLRVRSYAVVALGYEKLLWREVGEP